MVIIVQREDQVLYRCEELQTIVQHTSPRTTASVCNVRVRG
jgi:hypothetical protein